jgi:hypothetical protein
LRRASILWLSLVALAIAPAAEARKVRVFAVGPKLSIGWLESRETFRDKLFALADRRLRGPGTPLVQRGADDVASNLLGPEDPARPVETARDLVVWPESVGLFAALTGARAQSARTIGSLEGAILSIAATYGPQNAHYSARYPDLAGRFPPTRLLMLALMDTFGRTVLEPFAEMADRYDAYLVAGVDMPRDWRVVCTDRAAFNSASPPRLPGGVQCDEEDPQKVSALRDPAEPERDYAYEATTDEPSVIALVFDPLGRLVDKRIKSYITPLELGPTEGQLGLDLVPGEVSDTDARPLRTPVGTLGFVTSKPAWMPDVLQKLDQQHVDVLLQPEFFAGNLAVVDGQIWNPDVLLASGYNDLLRHPSIETHVLSEMTGGVFDVVADAQQHIGVKPRRNIAPAGFLVGQPPQPGLVQVAPWVVPDPARPGEPFPERRRRLGEAGAKLAPGSGVSCPDPAEPGPCEGGQVEGVLWRDVDVGVTRRYRRFRGRRQRTRFTPARPVRRSRRPQRNAALALRGRRGVLAFEERRGGRDQILLLRTRDGGRHWSRPVRPTGRPRGAADEWWPAVALGARGRVTVAWVDDSSGRERVYFSRSTTGGRRFGPPRALDPSPPPGVAQWKPALAQGPGDVVHAAFVDERTQHPDGGLPQAGTYYARIAGGAAERARRLDGGDPVQLAARLDNSWAPSVAARGRRVLVAWADFLNYDWDIHARLSDDGGGSFGAQRPLNDAVEDDPDTTENEQREALNDSPRAVLGRGGAFVAWTDWRKRDSASLEPHQQYDTMIAAPGGENVRVDPYGARPLSTFSPSACALRGDLLVAFQDASRGQNDLRIVRMRAGLRRGRARRVDDTGRRGGNAWRPQLACSRGRVIAAWEDERDGPPQVYAARARAARIR